MLWGSVLNPDSHLKGPVKSTNQILHYHNLYYMIQSIPKGTPVLANCIAFPAKLVRTDIRVYMFKWPNTSQQFLDASVRPPVHIAFFSECAKTRVFRCVLASL